MRNLHWIGTKMYQTAAYDNYVNHLVTSRYKVRPLKLQGNKWVHETKKIVDQYYKKVNGFTATSATKHEDNWNSLIFGSKSNS